MRLLISCFERFVRTAYRLLHRAVFTACLWTGAALLPVFFIVGGRQSFVNAAKDLVRFIDKSMPAER